MFHLKDALLENGWELMAAGDGTTYSAPSENNEAISDSLLVDVSSCDKTGAWFRIREPEHATPEEPRREFIFMRGTDNNRILIKYSRGLGFVTGGSASSCPTAEDGIVISNNTTLDSASTTSAAASVFSVTSAVYLQIVLNDQNTYGKDGAFPFWIWCYDAATGSPAWAMVHENVAPGTTSALDQDPTYQICTNSIANFLTRTGVLGGWWEAYGLPSATRRRSTSVRFCQQIRTSAYSTSSMPRFSPPATTLGLSPYEGQIIFYPMMIGVPGTLFKGYSTGVTCSGFTQQNILDVFKITTANPRILVYKDPNDRVSVFFPWIPSSLPLV
jgi:hypothetical protein